MAAGVQRESAGLLKSLASVLVVGRDVFKNRWRDVTGESHAYLWSLKVWRLGAGV